MENTNSLKISILGRVYIVNTDDSQEHVLAAAKLVDNLLREKLKKASLASESSVIAITALELASENVKLRESSEAWQNKVTQLNELLEIALI